VDATAKEARKIGSAIFFIISTFFEIVNINNRMGFSHKVVNTFLCASSVVGIVLLFLGHIEYRAIYEKVSDLCSVCN